MTDNNTIVMAARLLMDASHQEQSGFSAVVWAINGVILCLLVGVSAFCWYQNGCIYYYAPYSTGMSASDLAYARVVLERQRLEEERRRGTPEQRSKRVHHKLNTEKIVMTVKEEDLTLRALSPDGDQNTTLGDNDHANDNIPVDTKTTPKDENDIKTAKELDDMEQASMDDSANFELTLLRIQTTTGNRHVPGSCAICLCRYQVGDRVVWSNNDKCSHAFHDDCMVDWLVNVQEGAPCPCCRQEFVSMDGVDQPEKRTFRGTLNAMAERLPFYR